MANINVKKRLESVSKDIEAIAHHIALYGGIDKKDARYIDNLGAGIAEVAAAISAGAREAEGNRSAGTLVKNVRKALGYTRP